MILYRVVAESQSRKRLENYYFQLKQSRSVAGSGDGIAATLRHLDNSIGMRLLRWMSMILYG